MVENNLYPSKEKIKGRSAVADIFNEASCINSFPIKLFYLPIIDSNHKFGIGVSKRNFKKAVYRNRIKRLFREAYRLNKNKLPITVKFYSFFVLYIDKQMPLQYSNVEAFYLKALERLQTQLLKNENI
jgi:ribonuclease P protein component